MTSEKHKKTGTVLAAEVFFFVLVLALAVIDVRFGTRSLPVTHTSVGSSLFGFLAAFTAATLFLILLLKTIKGTRLFGVIFALAIMSGVGSLTYDLFGPSVSVIATAIAVLAYYALPYIAVYDLILAVGMAGVAATLSLSLLPVGVVMILAILAIYDIIAVYGTKHMVAMGSALLRKKVFFAMILPVRYRSFFRKLSDVEPGKDYFFLGTGDVVLPALMVSAVARTGLWPALSVVTGALMGLLITHTLFVKRAEMRPMPALPPIAMGSIIGYLVTFIFT